MIKKKTLEQASAEKGYLDAEKFDSLSDADIERSIAEDPDLAPPTESLLRLPDQVQQTVGERGIGVQVSGDGNTVTVYAGSTELRLVRKHLRKAKPKTELELFRVDLRATTLVGRDDERADLMEWLASDRQVSVRCIIGRAGAGKTRLAIELCDYAEGAGWTAGLAQYQQFLEFTKHSAEWRWTKPTLVVIDYAAALARDLRTWLEILARPEAQSGGHKLRLLLLERHAERDLGWWADLLRPLSLSDPAPDELADPSEPIPLQSLSAIEDRRALLAEAMRLAGQVAGIQVAPRPPVPGVNPDFDRRLGDDAINNEPLYLMMAGAEAIHTGAPAALALTRIDLAERAASREGERLSRLASQRNVSEKLLGHLTMCVTLQGGCCADDALRLVPEERSAMGFPEAVPAPEIVNLLAEALPMPGGLDIDAVRPDLIGEAFILQGMRAYRRFPKIQTAGVERAWRRAGEGTVSTLVRLAQDYAQGDPCHCGVVWLRHLIDASSDFAALMTLADQLPEYTLALREIAERATERINFRLTELEASDPELSPLLAVSLNNLAIRLSELERNEEALAAAEKAVELYRRLAARRPDIFRPNLASTLNTFANRLSDLGRYESALTAAEEAAALYSELAKQQPNTVRIGLGVALNNLSNRLSDLGRYEPALTVAEEAIVLYRKLAAERPNLFRSDLAGSFNTLSNRLSDLGRREAALAAAEEAAGLYRELAAQQPDAFRPHFAGSLTNVANRRGAVGKYEEALAAAEEAAAAYRRLATQRHEAFGPDFAASLINLAARLNEVGRNEAALTAAEEGAVLYRELAAQKPDTFQPNLAISLNNISVIRGALGQREEALEAAEEAVSLYRRLELARGDVFRTNLAGSLTNLANRLSELGGRAAALAAVEEAVGLYRELSAQRLDAFRPNLAISLAVRANCLEDLGRATDALEGIGEAIAILFPAFVEHGAAFHHRMVSMVERYRGRCERLGRKPDMELLAPVLTALRELDRQTQEKPR
jgi:Tetratricopeptide repeat